MLKPRSRTTAPMPVVRKTATVKETSEETAPEAAMAPADDAVASPTVETPAPAPAVIEKPKAAAKRKAEAPMAATSPAKWKTNAAFLSACKDVKAKPHTIVTADYVEEQFPSNSIILDHVLGLGGIPRSGRIVVLQGKEHGGKSTICCEIIEAFQIYTQGEPTVYFDHERTCTPRWLRATGVCTDPDRIQIRRPDSLDEAIKDTITYIEGGAKCLVYDSIPRMKTKAAAKDIQSGKALKDDVGRHARDMAKFFDIVLPYACEYNCTVLMVNQVRARIENSNEAASALKYKSITNLPYVTPGGNRVRFDPSVILEVNVSKAFRGAGSSDDPFLLEPEDKTAQGYKAIRVNIRVLKNKVNDGGYREFHLWLRPGRGLDDWISVRELAREYNLIWSRGRTWFVGKEDNPIATYSSKEEAVQDLVINQNLEVLTALRPMVVNAIEENAHNYTFVATEADMYLGGELSPEQEEELGFSSLEVDDVSLDDGFGDGDQI